MLACWIILRKFFKKLLYIKIICLYQLHNLLHNFINIFFIAFFLKYKKLLDREHDNYCTTILDSYNLGRNNVTHYYCVKYHISNYKIKVEINMTSNQLDEKEPTSKTPRHSVIMQIPARIGRLINSGFCHLKLRTTRTARLNQKYTCRVSDIDNYRTTLLSSNFTEVSKCERAIIRHIIIIT